VQCGYERHLQASQKLQDMSAGATSKDSIFMLQADQIDVTEIEKVRCLPVGSQVFFGQLEPHPVGIVGTAQ